LNNDRKLACRYRAGNVALPCCSSSVNRAATDKPLPDYVLKNQITKVADRIGAANNNLLPVPTLYAATAGDRQRAAAIGHLNALPDIMAA
jgi:hypothetical protein